VRKLGIEMRAGIHTGECEVADGKCSGLSVTIGARVMANAGPSEVLVSQTVKDLVAGSGLAFADAGEHDLRMYAITGTSTGSSKRASPPNASPNDAEVPRDAAARRDTPTDQRNDERFAFRPYRVKVAGSGHHNWCLLACSPATLRLCGLDAGHARGEPLSAMSRRVLP
jgi:hypothetical protein